MALPRPHPTTRSGILTRLSNALNRAILNRRKTLRAIIGAGLAAAITIAVLSFLQPPPKSAPTAGDPTLKAKSADSNQVDHSGRLADHERALAAKPEAGLGLEPGDRVEVLGLTPGPIGVIATSVAAEVRVLASNDDATVLAANRADALAIVTAQADGGIRLLALPKTASTD